MVWTDPSNPKVQDYNIALAKHVAQLGVDEIQFDYVRFPAEGDQKDAAFVFQNGSNGISAGRKHTRRQSGLNLRASGAKASPQERAHPGPGSSRSKRGHAPSKPSRRPVDRNALM